MPAYIETAQAANVFDATAALAAMRADWTALGDEALRHVSPLEGDLDPALTGHTV